MVDTHSSIRILNNYNGRVLEPSKGARSTKSTNTPTTSQTYIRQASLSIPEEVKAKMVEDLVKKYIDYENIGNDIWDKYFLKYFSTNDDKSETHKDNDNFFNWFENIYMYVDGSSHILYIE